MSAAKYIQETFQKEYSGKSPELWKHYKEKLIEWRRGENFARIEKPTNPARAHALGYKSKPGFVLVRTKIRRGGRRKSRPNSRRMPSKMGVNKFKPHKSLQLIAEERVARKYPNCEVLNSYWVGEDGSNKYFEVMLVDRSHPAIVADKDINWIITKRGRVHRGLTSAGKKSRRKQRGGSVPMSMKGKIKE
jgi:large subunit ribosomal protein L15e